MEITSPYGEHYSVLKEECLHYLTEHWTLRPSNLDQGPFYFGDMTFGAGGHSFALLQKDPRIQVVAVDQDPEALNNGKKMIEFHHLENRLELNWLNFQNFPSYLREQRKEIFEKQGGLQGLLMDLGVSSHQFDQGERGFSFRMEGPLDMRMNYLSEQDPTAADLVNSLSEEELSNLFYHYGEERLSRVIARKIVERRKTSPFKTTIELEEIIFHCYPKKGRHQKIHPATRCFQALRIAVNRELEVLEKALPEMVKLLAPGGRLLVISFHSLEDRIVKHLFRKLKEQHPEEISLITKKPIIPGEKELAENPRSRSAKLRVLQVEKPLEA